MAQPLILASSSPYRRALLRQLQLPFQYAAPLTDEETKPGENAGTRALRLAEEKARALACTYPQALIIGADQVAECSGHILHKPGSRERAIAQLGTCAGKRATFHTGLSVLDSASGRQSTCLETYTVYFRPLSKAQIERYVELEKPYDCAGAFKVEGLGITLFEKLEGTDINTLVGLPLIRLTDLLCEHGMDPLAPPLKTPGAAS
ncbi:Maf family protein [Microbulbifer spongiae]|uniref:7-methyl-GTP pyrophosphatase n=1 Tax=Microbulbifer spongiae TaxID=2944933 RepID=A0ABY9E8S0_9GAMM|nr:Maf family protein [Microbulbifer sp. MI-G]WKD48513.1 Maf family nucleotide pyrophosphatase [Microbulbifer sp. MI-G]